MAQSCMTVQDTVFVHIGMVNLTVNVLLVTLLLKHTVVAASAEEDAKMEVRHTLIEIITGLHIYK